MKITSVAVFTADVELAEQGLRLSGGRVRERLVTTIVRLDTDAGISGFGEICPFASLYEAGFTGGIHEGLKVLAPKLIGLNPLELEHVNQVIDRELVNHPHTKSPVDIACWDILGKYTKLPLYTLMGGRIQDKVETYYCTSKSNTQEACKDALAKQAEGYNMFHIKLSEPKEQHGERMRAFRASLGKNVALTGDANRGLLCDEAIQLARATADLRWFMEQPCRNLRDCAEVRRSACALVIPDESLVDIPAILQAHSEHAIDVAKLKISRLGGLTRTKQARDLCISLGIPVTIDDVWGTEITSAALAHLGHSTPQSYNRGIVNFGLYNDSVLAKHELTMSGPWVSASEEPGLGVTLDMDKLGEPIFVI